MPQLLCRRCKKSFHAKPWRRCLLLAGMPKEPRDQNLQGVQQVLSSEGKLNRRVYCSRKCYVAAGNAIFQESRVAKSCKWCGEAFEVALSRAKKKAYCSKECRILGVKEEQAKKRVDVVCEYCKREYSLSQCVKRDRNYCCKKCKHNDEGLPSRANTVVRSSLSSDMRLLVAGDAASVQLSVDWHGEKNKVFLLVALSVRGKHWPVPSSVSSGTNPISCGTGCRVRKTRKPAE